MGSMQMLWKHRRVHRIRSRIHGLFHAVHFPNITVALKVLDGDFGDELSALSVKKTGVRLLAYSQYGWRHFTNNKGDSHPADMKGLKIRTQEDPAMMKLVQSMDASATPIAWASCTRLCNRCGRR